MAFQREIEDMNIRSVDAAAEPTARMMKAVFRGVCRYDPDDREMMGEFGYLLGRFVYICDALDDLKDDFKKARLQPAGHQKHGYDHGGGDHPRKL